MDVIKEIKKTLLSKLYRNLLPILIGIAIITYLITIVYLVKDRNLDTKLFLAITGGLLGLLGFLAERYEKIIATRVELQTDFYKQWQDLRKDIRKIEDEAEGWDKFLEYFQFLNHEFDMKHHLSPQFREFYKVYRKNEFYDETKYGSKTHIEWWNKLKDKRFTLEFKDYINEIIDKINKDKRSSADRKDHTSAETGR